MPALRGHQPRQAQRPPAQSEAVHKALREAEQRERLAEDEARHEADRFDQRAIEKRQVAQQPSTLSDLREAYKSRLITQWTLVMQNQPNRNDWIAVMWLSFWQKLKNAASIHGEQIEGRTNHDKAACALANKMVRNCRTTLRDASQTQDKLLGLARKSICRG